MKRNFSPLFLRWAVASMTVIVIVAAAFAWIVRPLDADSMRRNVSLVVVRSWYELDCDGHAVAFFRDVQGDSLLVGPTLERDSAVTVSMMAGCWVDRYIALPSCEGRLVTVTSCRPDTVRRGVDSLVAHTRTALSRRIADMTLEQTELKYYVRVHGVQDNGYQEIAALSDRHAQLLDGDIRTLAVLDSLSPKKRYTLRRSVTYTAYVRTATGGTQVIDCRFVAADTSSSAVLLRTARGKTPEQVSSVGVLPWSAADTARIVVPSYCGVGEHIASDTAARCVIVGGRLDGAAHDLPAVLAVDGSPVFTVKGHFVGLTDGRRVISRASVRCLIGKGGER